ncbi:MAG: hypothetical protein ACFCVE_02000 [Phycisphaerae bacterium]
MTLMRTLCVVGALLPAGSALAAPSIPWTEPNGTTASFSWADGASENGLVTTPVSGDSFVVFFPQFFSASVMTGASSLVTESISVKLTAPKGHYFTNISTSFDGDYSIFGGGSVDATGAMFLTDLDSGQTLGATSTFTPPLPVVTQGGADGLFSSVASISPTGLWDTVMLQFDARLFSNSASGGAAVLAAKVLNIGVETAVIPLPPALLTAPIALGLVHFARRRMQKAGAN